MNRTRIGTILEVVSSAALTVGATMLTTAAGWIVGGALGLVYAWRLSQ